MTPAELPAPEVSAEVYDDAYFREACGGYEDWPPADVSQIGSTFARALDLCELEPGQTLVDIGCGRGELVALAAGSGIRAVGIDYSADAVRMARQTLETLGLEAHVLQGDGRRIPVADGSADAVTLLDVVEHLVPAELDATLLEARRMLRPGGRILIHTFPNRLLYDVTYRVQRAFVLRNRGDWPADPRNHWENLMHVNEQSGAGLRGALRKAGFPRPRVEHTKWVFTGFLPDGRGRWLYRALAAFPPTARFGRASLLATAHAPR